MDTPGYRDHAPPAGDQAGPVDPAEAEEFLRRLHHEHPTVGPLQRRLDQVRREIAESGTYVHTPAELQFGARMAWRNASRCIGRLYWRSLLVRDLRTVHRAEDIHAELVRHLELAAGTQGPGAGGTRKIRPIVSVFPPAEPGRPHARVWNDQLIRYAGFREPDGSVIGDPRYVRFTEALTERGWRGKRD